MVTPCPSLRLRRVDRGREDAGKVVQNTRDRSNSRRSGKKGKGQGRELAPPPASSKALSLIDTRS